MAAAEAAVAAAAAGADLAVGPRLRSWRRRVAPWSQSPSAITSRYCQPPHPGHTLLHCWQHRCWQHRSPAALAAALPAPVPAPAPPDPPLTAAPFRRSLDATLPSEAFVSGFVEAFDATGG